MSSRSLSRRLERLEAELMPEEEHVLRVRLTRVGQPEKIIEVHLAAPNRSGRRRWYGGRDRPLRGTSSEY
jgi:hypothetical protein